MTRFVPAVVFVFTSLAAATAQPPDDLKAMGGKWELVKSELGGKDISAALKTLDFRIGPGGTYVAKVGAEVDEGTFTLDPAKAPKQMDIKTGKGGPDAGKTLKAIYKLDGDSRVICYQLGGGDRPAAFKTTAGTKEYLAEYKRAK